MCPKLALSQEQNFRGCCPKGLRVLSSVKTVRNLTTTPKGQNFGKRLCKCFSLGVKTSLLLAGRGARSQVGAGVPRSSQRYVGF